MYKAVILPIAKQDIKNAPFWYEQQQKGLGKKFTTEIRRKIQLIRINPQAYSIRYSNIRTSVMDIFPFMIHFSIDDTDKSIIVIAVLHTADDPKKWKR